MKIDIARALKNPGQSYAIGMDAALPQMDVLDDPVSFDGIRLVGEYVGGGESVSVNGHIDAVVHSRCALCLGEVVMPISADIDEVFTCKLDPENPDAYPIEGTFIDLQPLIQDSLILELPIRFVCKEDCKGLCSVCGVNRNEIHCSCQENEEAKGPLSALRGLLTEEEEV